MKISAHARRLSGIKFLGNDHLTWKGGMFFFLKKNILIPNVAEKNILILVEKKKIWFWKNNHTPLLQVKWSDP